MREVFGKVWLVVGLTVMQFNDCVCAELPKDVCSLVCYMQENVCKKLAALRAATDVPYDDMFCQCLRACTGNWVQPYSDSHTLILEVGALLSADRANIERKVAKLLLRNLPVSSLHVLARTLEPDSIVQIIEEQWCRKLFVDYYDPNSVCARSEATLVTVIHDLNAMTRGYPAVLVIAAGSMVGNGYVERFEQILEASQATLRLKLTSHGTVAFKKLLINYTACGTTGENADRYYYRLAQADVAAALNICYLLWESEYKERFGFFQILQTQLNDWDS